MVDRMNSFISRVATQFDCLMFFGVFSTSACSSKANSSFSVLWLQSDSELQKTHRAPSLKEEHFRNLQTSFSHSAHTDVASNMEAEGGGVTAHQQTAQRGSAEITTGIPAEVVLPVTAQEV